MKAPNNALCATFLLGVLAIIPSPLAAQELSNPEAHFRTGDSPIITAIGTNEQALHASSQNASARSGIRLWKVSVAALVASNAMDIHSSWKKRELNPLLSPSSSAFGWQAALVKTGITSAIVGIEYLVARHNRQSGLYRTLSITNFTTGAVVCAVAIHNSELPSAQH